MQVHTGTWSPTVHPRGTMQVHWEHLHGVPIYLRRNLSVPCRHTRGTCSHALHHQGTMQAHAWSSVVHPQGAIQAHIGPLVTCHAASRRHVDAYKVIGHVCRTLRAPRRHMGCISISGAPSMPHANEHVLLGNH